MDSKFSVVLTIDGALSAGKISAALRRYADALDGNHYPDVPVSSPSKAEAVAKAVVAPKAETVSEPVKKTKAAPKTTAKLAAVKSPVEEDVAATSDVEEEVDFEVEEDLELDGTKTLSLAEDVLPAFKAFLNKRAAALGDVTKAREEIASLMKTKFGVKSGRVADLDSKHFKAAMDAIK